MSTWALQEFFFLEDQKHFWIQKLAAEVGGKGGEESREEGRRARKEVRSSKKKKEGER